ncbi:MFS transporter [Candidatus Woesearchaeota archaeon]|jgi:MFS family permease|nr:MFS transporter [Candidatus Woesearchaeota archaeon]MBT5342791.1 MFS transporter [Candidatus Woesearchaeota archaeon]
MHHHNEHLLWKFFPHKELTQVYISSAIRNFAISLISLFVPLYLYKELGFPIEQVLYFFMFYAVTFAILTPLAAKFSARYGLKHSVLFSVPLYLLFVISLYFLPYYQIPLMIIAGLLGASQAFYWMGMHLVFTRVSDHKHRGEEIGKRISISILGAMFGPLIGGFLIKFVGFKPVFILTSSLLFFSAFFLFLSKEDHVSYHFSIRSLIDKRQWRNDLFFTARGIHVIAAGVIWPMFIFLILDDYFSLGLVGFLLSGISAILVFLMGKYSDHHGKRKIVRWVVGFESLSWFLRALVTTVGHVFGATILGAFTYGVIEAPLGAMEYDKAKEKIANYFVNREIFLCIGRILMLIFVLMADSLSGGLIFNGFANLMVLLF